VRVEQLVAASRQPGSARAGEALHWQFVLRDIPAIVPRRRRGLRLPAADCAADDLQLRVVPGAGHFLPTEPPTFATCWPGSRPSTARSSSCATWRDRTSRQPGRCSTCPRDRAPTVVQGQAQLPEGVDAVNQDWPVAGLDPVRRMRVLAAAVPGAAYAGKLIPAPFSAVWEAVSDLEHDDRRSIVTLLTRT
jgi:hypothetical protein